MRIDRKHFLRLAAGLVAGLAAGLSCRATAAADAGSQPVRAKLPKEPWEKVDFTYARGGRSFPGTAVRLPGKDGEAGALYAACRVCPHQGCTFGYETNYRTVGNIVGKDLENPVFFCRCHMSVYDPLQDGRVLNGPSTRPPWRFAVEENDGELLVTELEEGAGEIPRS
jgi:Rieske Fe-S protein